MADSGFESGSRGWHKQRHVCRHSTWQCHPQCATCGQIHSHVASLPALCLCSMQLKTGRVKGTRLCNITRQRANLGAVGADGEVAAVSGPGQGGDVIVLLLRGAQLADVAVAGVPKVHRRPKRHGQLTGCVRSRRTSAIWESTVAEACRGRLYGMRSAHDGESADDQW